jgi:hypothetical protein
MRSIAASVFGLVFTFVFVYLPASVQDQTSIPQDLRVELNVSSIRSPEYITPFASPLSSVETSEMTFATHWTEFNYWQPEEERTAWDPADPDQIPVFVKITRFYYGWPFRAMYYDWIGINTDGRWDHMKDYFDRVNTAAGIDVGIETPDWWPAVKENRRLPVRPRLGGFILNTLISAFAWICIASFIRWIIRSKRRRVGRCAECAYQIDELQLCPECGSSRT